MNITINQTAEGLDPAVTSENPEESLVNYIAELTEEILKVYPDAEIEHKEQDSFTYGIDVDDDPDGSISIELQDIAEGVFAAGNFWA